MNNHDIFRNLSRIDADLGQPPDRAEPLGGARPKAGPKVEGGAFPTIRLRGGGTAEAVDRLVALMRDDPDLFDHGGALALVAGRRVHHLCEHGTSQHVGRRVAFERKDKDAAWQSVDPPVRLVRQALALGDRRRLKRLSAVITAPTITPEGRVIDRPGHDAATGLLLVGGGWPAIPARPTEAEARAALDVLVHPFRAFPFVGPLDRGALLAALLTAVCRPALDTAPAIAFDAPVQGSGKTLLATAVGVLAGGEAPQIWPHTATRDDEETRKRLFVMLRTAPAALVWDNVTGVFDSAALAAFLTAPALTDRVLGRSEMLTIPNRSLFVLTGNNMALAGDLPRRVLRCRIDPRSATPFDRQFGFDPVAEVRRDRLSLAVAAVTLMRARLLSDAPAAPGDVGSFEGWARLVRQSVAWAGRELDPGAYGDPAEALAEATVADPDAEGLGDLLAALADRFGAAAFGAADVIVAAGERPAIRAALTDLAGSDRVVQSSKSAAKALRFREGRIVGGLRLAGKQVRDRRAWRVEAVE